MKYLMLALFLIGCGGSSVEVKEIPVEPVAPVVWVDTAITQVINGGQTRYDYNATVEELNANSWLFTSNTNDKCIDRTDFWSCKRGDVHMTEFEPDNTTMYEFDFTVYEYPFIDGPYWVIVLQSRREGHSPFENGRHPMTTLKVKNYNGHLYLGHFDNAWQYNEDAFINNPDDKIHSLPDHERGCYTVIEIDLNAVNHQENRCNGVVRLELSATYKVQLIVSPEHASLIVDGKVISYQEYRTQGDGLSNINIGMYWDEFYNAANDPDLRTVYSIESFTRKIKG